MMGGNKIDKKHLLLFLSSVIDDWQSGKKTGNIILDIEFYQGFVSKAKSQQTQPIKAKD
jgi:hypothetical protein